MSRIVFVVAEVQSYVINVMWISTSSTQSARGRTVASCIVQTVSGQVERITEVFSAFQVIIFGISCSSRLNKMMCLFLSKLKLDSNVILTFKKGISRKFYWQMYELNG